MEREYRRPRLVIEEVRSKYKFLNTMGVRCNLESDGGSDYSVAYEGNRHSSPCSGMYCREPRNIGIVKQFQKKLMI